MEKLARGPVERGNVVEEYRLENTCIRICDDAFRNRSAAEQAEALRALSRVAGEALAGPLHLTEEDEEESI